jgi:hypothetical protein
LTYYSLFEVLDKQTKVLDLAEETSSTEEVKVEG